MSEIPAHVVAGWWRTLARHGGGSVCPIDGVPRCWAYSDAYAALLQLDLFHLGPPGPVEQAQTTRSDDSNRLTTGSTVRR